MNILQIFKEAIKISLRTVKNEIKCSLSKKALKIDDKRKYIVVFFAADYNNIGDVAITIAQCNYLRAQFPDCTLIKVPVDNTFDYIKPLLKIDKENLLVTLIGGGNNSDLYEFIEAPRRFVLKKFRNYRIISFPQTVYYSNSEIGTLYKKLFSFYANRCKKLTLTARENESYKIYHGIVKGEVLLSPDIVFTLNIDYEKSLFRENKVAFIMRSDDEKSIDARIQKKLEDKVISRGFLLKFLDTCDVDCSEGYESALRKYLETLSKFKFAITDRLHGMILCYLTETPCLVIGNNNHKIQSTYETWLSNQEGIIFVNQPGDFDYDTAIDDLSKILLSKNDISFGFSEIKAELSKFN